MGGQRDKLLVVDNEALIADATALIFRRAGYDAKPTYSAEQALELIRDWRPAAAILDVHLPEIDGIELARHMRRLFPDCRIVLFSGQCGLEDNPAVAREFPVLAKPLHPRDLVAFISARLQAA